MFLITRFCSSIDHDPCTSGPCHNNGTCSRRGSTQDYDCICPGYTGKLCDTGKT